MTPSRHRSGRLRGHNPSPDHTIRQIYRTLSRLWGPQHWWPAETPFEVITGAILTQSTSWKNVERALANLRLAGILSVSGIREAPLSELEQLVRPSGYFRQKAKRLKSFVSYLDEKYAGSLNNLFDVPTSALRSELLNLKGIGPETADAILLYAAHREVFVVDAYARRILERHRACSANVKYNDLQNLIQGALRQERKHTRSSGAKAVQGPPTHAPTVMSTSQRSDIAAIYNEMHGLLVQVGKHYCYRRMPNCFNCPLGEMLSRNDRERLTASNTFNSPSRGKAPESRL